MMNFECEAFGLKGFYIQSSKRFARILADGRLLFIALQWSSSLCPMKLLPLPYEVPPSAPRWVEKSTVPSTTLLGTDLWLHTHPHPVMTSSYDSCQHVLSCSPSTFVWFDSMKQILSLSVGDKQHASSSYDCVHKILSSFLSIATSWTMEVEQNIAYI